jgi:hypothetical protein
MMNHREEWRLETKQVSTCSRKVEEGWREFELMTRGFVLVSLGEDVPKGLWI